MSNFVLKTALTILLMVLLLDTQTYSLPERGGQLTIAVASNVLQPMQELAGVFEKESGYHVNISAGSTGKHYAQIKNGAPFDVFMAADSLRPRLLEEAGYTADDSDSRITYVLGNLVLWSKEPGDKDCLQRLKDDQFLHIAIANPETAPYGMAAKQVLIKLGLWDAVREKLVVGENISHTFQYIQSGNAQLAFVAASQLASIDNAEGCRWNVATSYHEPLVQQAVWLKSAEHPSSAKAFMTFLQSISAREIFQDYGYGLP